MVGNFLRPKKQNINIVQSRHQKTQIKLCKAAEGCQKISFYFPILNEMEIILKERDDLKLRSATSMCKASKVKEPPTNFKILNILLDCAEFNAGKKANAKRYSVVIKELAFLVYSLGGLGLYEIFSFKDNFPFPAISTIRRKIYCNDKFAEGVFRIKPLKDFLILHDCPLVVFLCEDATAVTGRIQYDSATNQIVGPTLPLDSNGLPRVGSFPATSAETIAQHFQNNPTSRYAYCIMAVPLKEGAPSFCLCLFGTDNKFKTEHVKKRIEWTKEALQKEGIQVIGTGADGDGRLLSTMCQNVISPESAEGWPWFSAKKCVQDVYVQDHIHIGTKLKSRLLKPSIILPLGKDHIISRGHLVELIDTVSKDQHELTQSHINPKDKMNYRAVQKISAPKVTSLLRSKITNSEGTALYLDMIREVMESYMKLDLTPLARIQLIWKWLFFLRMWRTFIQDSKGEYTVKNNFISSNSYACIEINAHCLIQYIILLRDAELHALFLPWKLSSQECEKIFRVLRSALASKCGVTTFTILELEYHFRRLDMLSSTYVNLSQVMAFPRHFKAAVTGEEAPHIPISLPENYEIEAAVLTALKEAVDLAKKFNLVPKNYKEEFIPRTHLKCRAEDLVDEEQEGSIDDLVNIECEEDEVLATEAELEAEKEDHDGELVEDLFIVSSGALGVKKFNDVPLSVTSPFVLVGDGFGNPAIIRKPTLCWLLLSGDTKLSSDRLTRVMAGPVSHSTSTSGRKTTNAPTIEETIHVGDWCAFKEGNTIAIGRILAFSYLSGTSLRDQEYSKLCAPTKAPNNSQARGLGCLCSWFYFKGNSKTLHKTRMEVHGYYNLNTYICHIPRPHYKEENLTSACSLRDILKLKK